MDHVTPPEVQAEKTQRPPMPDKTQRPTAPISEATQRPPAPSGDKTQRPPANDKTQRPGAPMGDKTQRPGQIAADKTTRAANKPQEDTALVASMAPMTEYTLDGVTYQVVQVISKSTGEVEILLIENQGKQYVLKLYFPDYKLPSIDIMEAICQSAGTGLLVATYRYGQWRHPMDKVERDYELMEYCSGGSLDQLQLNGDEKLLGEIALQCAVCIDFLHKKHIIHRDIKPANFFFRQPGQQIEDLKIGRAHV